MTMACDATCVMVRGFYGHGLNSNWDRLSTRCAKEPVCHDLICFRPLKNKVKMTTCMVRQATNDIVARTVSLATAACHSLATHLVSQGCWKKGQSPLMCHGNSTQPEVAARVVDAHFHLAVGDMNWRRRSPLLAHC